jgi:DNA-binding transcriptional LysR family regulator
MLSKELHFTRAAEKLGITQPTLSHQIKVLEQEIGHPLFYRTGKKIELTEIGEIVLHEAQNIKKSLQNITSQIEAYTDMEFGELKIAVLPGEMTDLVSTLCVRFLELYPNIKVHIHTTDQIEQAILENEADFGIGFSFKDRESLCITKLYEEEFYLIRNSDKQREPISFASLMDESLVLFQHTHQCRKLLDQVSSKFGRSLEPIVETSSTESILNLVHNGVGCSVVSRTLYEFYDTRGLFYQPIEKPSLNRPVYLLMRKNNYINYATRQFLDLLVKEINQLHFNTDKTSMDALQQSLL